LRIFIIWCAVGGKTHPVIHSIIAGVQGDLCCCFAVVIICSSAGLPAAVLKFRVCVTRAICAAFVLRAKCSRPGCV
jgi:hypothetical protein